MRKQYSKMELLELDDLDVGSQIRSHHQLGELQWERAWETEGKMWRCQLRHQGLLGLTHRESRHGPLDEVPHGCQGQGGSCLYGVSGKDCVYQGWGGRGYVVCEKESFLCDQHPKEQNLGQRLCLPIRHFHRQGGPGFSQPQVTYHTPEHKPRKRGPCGDMVILAQKVTSGQCLSPLWRRREKALSLGEKYSRGKWADESSVAEMEYRRRADWKRAAET